jgi:hypothetical protein
MSNNMLHQLSEGIEHGEVLRITYQELLSEIVRERWHGACHSSSAILYLLLAEQGLEPTLCIGEVHSGIYRFDHSWVEVDGLIYDAAVGYPQENEGMYVSPPVFASADMEEGMPTHLKYGLPGSLAEDGLLVANSDLDEYSELQPAEYEIWTVAEEIADRMGLAMCCSELRQKYGAIRRTLRGC